MASSARMEPNWARVPPHVPTYPNPPAYFRQTPAEKYTQPEGQKAYQKWWTKWQPDFPEFRDEHYRLDSRAPMMRKKEFESGVMRPPYSAPTCKPEWRQEYLKQGRPDTEATRARGLNRIHFATQDKNLYPFSNAMLSTQYKKPVTGIYGHLLREKVYGVNTMNNRHGFMPSMNYYF